MGVLETASELAFDLKYRTNTTDFIQASMLDLDSAEGKTACQKYLDSLASLLRDLGGSSDKRLHRMGFTATYKKMVNQRHYLADVLDSAQEAMPFMWVNGEKYVFSEHVISKGIELYQLF
jgi:hypothetical protein